jgi:hypothetical protein
MGVGDDEGGETRGHRRSTAPIRGMASGERAADPPTINQ